MYYLIKLIPEKNRVVFIKFYVGTLVLCQYKLKGWLTVFYQTSDIVIIQELTDVQIKFVFVSLYPLAVNVAFSSFVSVMIWPILYTLLAYSFLLPYNYIYIKFFCIYIFVCIRFYNCFRMFGYICMPLIINLYNWHFNIYNDWTHEINKILLYKQNINFSITIRRYDDWYFDRWYHSTGICYFGVFIYLKLQIHSNLSDRLSLALFAYLFLNIDYPKF